MNKPLIFVFLLILGLTVTDQSWAMGKRGGSGGSNGSGSSNYNHFQNNPFGVHHDTANHDEDNSNDNKIGNNDHNNAPQGFYDDQQSFSDDEFPAATTVPEPATLSLVGMGLAGILLKKRKQ